MRTKVRRPHCTAPSEPQWQLVVPLTSADERHRCCAGCPRRPSEGQIPPLLGRVGLAHRLRRRRGQNRRGSAKERVRLGRWTVATAPQRPHAYTPASLSPSVPRNSDAVLLCDHNNNTLGWGAVNMDSMYRVRVLQTAAEAAGSPDATLSFPDIVASAPSHPPARGALATAALLSSIRNSQLRSESCIPADAASHAPAATQSGCPPPRPRGGGWVSPRRAPAQGTVS